MKLWMIVLTGLVFLLLADVAVLQARLQSFGLGELKAEVEAMRDSLARLQDWEAVVAEQPAPSAMPPTPVATPVVRPAGGSAGLKEVYIPLGSGSTNNQEWVDTGAQAYIDTGQYRIKAAYFEASLRANSGQVWARLINKNENEYVASSEISYNTPTATLIRSGKLSLPAGNKLYGVQIRGETQQQVWAENARVRLLVQE